MKTFVEVPAGVVVIRDLMREASYSDPRLYPEGVHELDRFVHSLHGSDNPDAPVYRLWALCLKSEILDYNAKYDDALKTVKEDGGAIEHQMRDAAAVDRKEGRLTRQKLWVLCFYAHCFYRTSTTAGYKRAMDLLALARKVLDSHFPESGLEPCFGLRARIAYSLGQVNRQMGLVTAARKEFVTSVECTRKRLEAKLKKYSGPMNEKTRLREQRFANFVTAKTFSFGLTWAANNEGALQRARGSAAAGLTMFLSTNDEVHKAYAKVMYAQILRSLSPPADSRLGVSPDLQEALQLLESVVKDPKTALRIVPQFFMRARYEYARALFLAGQLTEAEAETAEIYGADAAKDRHRVTAGALLIRILCSQGRTQNAVEVSDELYELINAGGKGSVDDVGRPNSNSTLDNPSKIEILLTRAETLMRLQAPPFSQIDSCLQQARELSKENPVSLAVCALQRSRFYALQEQTEYAKRSLQEWEHLGKLIESGLLRQLALDIRAEIEALESDLTLRLSDLEAKGYRGVEELVQRWAIRSLYAKFGADYLTDKHVQGFLGMSRENVRLWQKKLNYHPNPSSGPKNRRSRKS
ncbi:MAG: hypothetical protein JST16_18215 [Bdellovibrionales bacterium]|nr:hypothetical protein [Bdellovibrionales bacterium]